MIDNIKSKITHGQTCDVSVNLGWASCYDDYVTLYGSLVNVSDPTH